MSYNEYLRHIYYDLSHPGSYSGVEKLFRVIKQDGKFNISRQQISQWLKKQETYTLYRRNRLKFTRRKIVTSGVDSEWGIDLADFRNIAKYNNNYTFLLVCVDVFSRYLFIKPLKNKTGKEVVKGLKKIFSNGRQPYVIHFDRGKEFLNRTVIGFLKSRNIKYFNSDNEDIKSSLTERVIQTVRSKLYKYFHNRRSYKYFDVINSVTGSINNTPHKSLGFLKPSEINKSNEEKIWLNIWKHSNKLYQRTKPQTRFRYKVGDLVRIVYLRHPFQRVFHQKWTTEVFKVVKRMKSEYINVYFLTDLLNEAISGKFYEDEILGVSKEENLWTVSEILKKRKETKR
jgi:hypothetical protein